MAQVAGTGWLSLGLVERLLLKVMADMGGTPDRPYQGCAPMVEELYARHGVQPVHGYGALVRLAADWLVPLRLIDGHGNLGSADFPAAEMAYVEARLTPAGLLAAEHEALDGVVALAVGDLAFDGQRPPFELSGVRAAMQAVIDDPDADAETVRRLIGPPVFVGGADAEGPLEALLDGDPTTFRVRAHVESLPGRSHDLSITRLPTGVGAAEAASVLSSMLGLSGPPAEWDAEDGPWEPDVSLAITSLVESRAGGIDRIVATVAPAADVNEVPERLREIEPLALDVELLLPTRIETLVRSLVEGEAPEELTGLLNELLQAGERPPTTRLRQGSFRKSSDYEGES